MGVPQCASKHFEEKTICFYLLKDTETCEHKQPMTDENNPEYYFKM